MQWRLVSQYAQFNLSFVWLTLSVVVGCAPAAPVELKHTTSTRPNIVLFYADDLDADEIGCTSSQDNWATYTGFNKLRGWNRIKNRLGVNREKLLLTPNIDSLANTGATLTRFYITSPACTPSRYTLLTGRIASRNPVKQKSYARIDWRGPLHSRETSLPKTLQRAGYKTGVVGKWHNFSKRRSIFLRIPHDVTFEFLKSANINEQLKEQHERDVAELSNGFGWDFVDRISNGNTAFNLEWMVEGALQFIDENHDQPFFLYVPLAVPHGGYSDRANQVDQLEPLATAAGLIDHLPDVMPSRASVYERLRAANMPRNNAMATHMDDAVGAILDKLSEMKVRENTIVFFISDHGSFGKYSCYEGAARVPAFVNWPVGIKAGGRIESLTGNLDMAATLTSIAGLEPPADMQQDGQSFLPQLLGRQEPKNWRKSILLEAGYSKAVVSKRWKYIANRPPPEILEKMKEDAEHASATGQHRTIFWTGSTLHSFGNHRKFPHYFDKDQLYDLENDLYARTNLANDPAYATVLAEQKERLSEFLESLTVTFGEFKETGPGERIAP